MVELGPREDPFGKPRMAPQRPLEALDLQQVDSDCGCDRYFSTPATIRVTLASPSLSLPETR
jgi:hypothetical protein